MFLFFNRISLVTWCGTSFFRAQEVNGSIAYLQNFLEVRGWIRLVLWGWLEWKGHETWCTSGCLVVMGKEGG